MFSKISKVAVLVAVAMMVMIAGMAFGVRTAQAQAPKNSIEFVGVLQAISSESLTVDKQVVDITNAEVSPKLTVGQTVKVEGTLNTDLTVTAREVSLAAKTVVAGVVEVTGTVTQLSATEIVVAGLTFDISKAEVSAKVAVGVVVKVEAVRNANGTLIASEVKLPTAKQSGTDDSQDKKNEDSKIGSDDKRQEDKQEDRREDRGGDDKGGDNKGKGGDDKGKDN